MLGQYRTISDVGGPFFLISGLISAITTTILQWREASFDIYIPVKLVLKR